MRCRLCGHDFDPAGLGCHSSCALAPRCAIICCPRCGYQVPDESRSRLAMAAERAFGRLRGRRGAAGGRA